MCVAEFHSTATVFGAVRVTPVRTQEWHMRKVDLEEQVTVRLPRHLREAAEAAAERERRPLAQKLRNLIEDGLAGASRGAAA